MPDDAATASGPAAGGRPELPVVVIGGGPVGLSLAMELRYHGVGCAVIEPRTSVSAVRPRAKTTSARTMELFRRWGFAERIRARAPIPVSWSSDVVFCTAAAGAEVTRFTGTLGLGLAGDDLVAEPGQQVGQPVVEQALRGFDRGDHPGVGHDVMRAVHDALAVEDANAREDLPHYRLPSGRY